MSSHYPAARTGESHFLQRHTYCISLAASGSQRVLGFVAFHLRVLLCPKNALSARSSAFVAAESWKRDLEWNIEIVTKAPRPVRLRSLFLLLPLARTFSKERTPTIRGYRPQ